MRRSEIFDSFVKIAQEKGLVSEDAPEKAKKKLEQDPRASSQSVKDIEALYGVKPDAPKNMEYEKNIMQDAHPESVIISPSYDKLNGLVENNNERQNILLHIVNKVPNGQLTQHKYAQKELILSLVRLGNDLDNKGKEDLRVLADTCLEQVSAQEKKSLVKNAVGPVAIVGAIALAFGAIYAHQHLPNIARGFKQDSTRLKAAVEDLLNSSISVGFGIEVTDQVKNDLTRFLKYLGDFETIYDRLYPAMVAVERPRDARELLEEDNKAKAQQAGKAMEILKSKLNIMKPFMTKVQKNFSSEDYKSRVTKDTGTFTEIGEATHLYGGATALIGDKFQSIVNEIPAYITAIDNSIKVLDGAQYQADSTAQALNASLAGEKSGNQMGSAVPETTFEDEKHPDVSKTDRDLTNLLGG